MKRVFTVKVDVPITQGVTAQMMAEYIHKAISSWTGGMDEAHPLGCKDISPTVSYEERGETVTIQELVVGEVR